MDGIGGPGQKAGGWVLSEAKRLAGGWGPFWAVAQPAHTAKPSKAAALLVGSGQQQAGAGVTGSQRSFHHVPLRLGTVPRAWGEIWGPRVLGLQATRGVVRLRVHGPQRMRLLLVSFCHRTPQALHSVLGPMGPARHTGVACNAPSQHSM